MTLYFFSWLDERAFSLLHPLDSSFWRFTLTFPGDLLLTLCLLALGLAYIRPSPRERLFPLLLFGGVGLLALFLAKWFMPDRLSPSGEVVGCFPSDHGVALLLATLFFFSFGRGWQGVAALLLFVYYCGGRLITGAHWLTDILVGSLLLVTLLFAFLVSVFFFFQRRLAR